MVLLSLFHSAALWPRRFPFAISLLKSMRYFFATATVLAFSISTATLVTFWHRRSESNLLHANFGYFNFYANLMLALAPPLSVMPAVVLVMMPPEVRIEERDEEIRVWDKGKGRNMKLYLARLAVMTLYMFCIAVPWMIWSVGVRDQRNPTHIVFGGSKNVQVSSFIYKYSRTYILLVCILMVALPAAGLAALAALWVWHNVCQTDEKQRRQSLSFLRNRCRDTCFLFGISQLSMFAYIRGQAIHQADGATSETDWGFGQILIVFTWLPLLLRISSDIASAICHWLWDNLYRW